MCAGSIKRFRAVGFEKCGRRLRVIKAGGCLGKSAVALAPPSNSSRRGAGGELAWPAEMPQARAPPGLGRHFLPWSLVAPPRHDFFAEPALS